MHIIVEIGASSACFYPLETEKSFLNITEMGFPCCEIFFNAHSELRKDFIMELKAMKDACGTDIISLHPYASFSEGYDFFSAYKRRFGDALENYRRYYEAAEILGAKYIVMHGAAKLYDITMEEYAERYLIATKEAEKYGCYVAHENVVKFLSATPDFSRFMKNQLGEDYKMVLDVKQVRRAGFTADDFIDAAGENIVHVHLSDFNEKSDCVAPSEKGMYDFGQLFTSLGKAGYKGKYVVELYSDGYEKSDEIIRSAEYLDGILKKSRQG
ncbi:MAG: sugar phosphate isomerase/epimerase [Clostridia bacterium]|nr:sugar phosphate isomerase/epimerase [Clostridia bacterium]